MTRRDGDWRRARLGRSRLYVCVDLRRERGDLAALLDSALAGGVDIIQLRDKEADRDALAAGGEMFRGAAERHGALYVMNDDPELAVQTGADGVHVGQEDATPAEARSVVGRARLVGLSTHTEEQFVQGLGEDTDYLAIGPVHETPTKEGRPGIGLRPLRAAAEVADRPWFVTGGMARDTVGEVLAAGAERVVVVRAIVDADDPGRAARELARLLADVRARRSRR